VREGEDAPDAALDPGTALLGARLLGVRVVLELVALAPAAGLAVLAAVLDALEEDRSRLVTALAADLRRDEGCGSAQRLPHGPQPLT